MARWVAHWLAVLKVHGSNPSANNILKIVIVVISGRKARKLFTSEKNYNGYQ
jgi:hypothetical protein